jgi:DNA-binding HxlR family transcriptional regulator
MSQERTSSSGAYAAVSASDPQGLPPLDPPVVDDPSCPVRLVLDRVADKWTAQTIDGLVDRTVEPGPPLKVTYELTPFGHTLVPPLAGLVAWARTHGPRLLNRT